MNVILFSAEQTQFYPLSFTRPMGELRMGIFTFRERWSKLLNAEVSYSTDTYLSSKYPMSIKSDNWFINPCYFPDAELLEAIKNLKEGEALLKDESWVAFRGEVSDFEKRGAKETKRISFPVLYIDRSYRLFSENKHAICYDFNLMTQERESQDLSETNQVFGKENIFIEKGAKVECAILNAKEGPIYIGKDAEIMEGSILRGPIALCEHATIKMGAKIYGETTIGPHCKVGGEVSGSILTGYSNKGHDGFLGNSVLGEWCNLGADTNNSNLKNNYSEVKLWSYTQNKFEKTGLQFCGLIMGDHAKSAINTQFNTGTVVGPFANIFQSGFPPNKVNSFSWGGKRESPRYNLDKALETAERMMGRRKIELTQVDKEIYTYLSEQEK